MTLDVSSTGMLYVKSQLTDYMLRGSELEDYSVYSFVMDTYDTAIRPGDGEEGVQDQSDAARRPGRPRHLRARYRDGHPCVKTKQRMVRASVHRTLVNVIGRWFPRNDDPETRNTYCASMLLLLKPWCNVATDLKAPEGSWEDAFAVFVAQASEAEKYVMSGAQYFHECALAAEADRREEDAADTVPGRRERDYDLMDEDEEDVLGEGGLHETVYTEEGLAALKASQVSLPERLHALHAIDAAQRARFFSDCRVTAWPVTGAKAVTAATVQQLHKLQGWRSQLATDVAGQQQRSDGQSGEVATGSGAAVIAGAPLDAGDPNPSVHHTAPDSGIGEDALPAVDINFLRADQYRAYDIVVWHLERTLAGDKVPPLRMVLYGEGGTGKSRVIQTVTNAFAARGCAFMLVKAAYTGIAASLIDGKTTHVIAHPAVGKDGQLTDDAKRDLQAFWKGKKYLILDEFSMLAKGFFAVLSRHIGIGVEGEGLDRDASFGGISVILCGDLHQFPPVASGLAEALFMRTDNDRDLTHPDRILGRRIYKEFTTVVILREQMRVSDPVWRGFLVHLRYGRVEQRHIAMLRTLVLAPDQDAPVDVAAAAAFADASLVTPRHAVRNEWNTAAARKWCEDKNERLYIVTAEDRIQGRPLTLKERYAVAGRMKTAKGRKRKDLPERIELAIGMKVMVTSNIQTDLDLANGARGEIVDIMLHPDEEPVGDRPVVLLQHLPVCVLVKMARTRASPLEGLPTGVIPVEPLKISMQIQHTRTVGAPLRRTVHRRQFPITAAYAFTDYRSQGQTIPTVIVDIKSPPGPAKLSLFNLYVALSRSSGRQTIRLLRDFDPRLFFEAHEDDLLKEDERLEDEDRKTKQWWVNMGRADVRGRLNRCVA